MFQKIFQLMIRNCNKTEIYRYVQHFSVYYDNTDVDDILDIHKYLMEKNMR